MIKGETFEVKESKQSLFTGFTKVEVVAVNPTRAEEAAVYGRDIDDSKDEIEYTSEDSEGNKRVRLAFILKDEDGRFFRHSFNLLDKPSQNKAGTKLEFVNSVMNTTYAEDQKSLPEWFTTLKDKDGTILAERNFRGAVVGERDLAVLLRSWLGRLKWSQPQSSVEVDVSRLFKGDFNELKEMVDSVYAAPFIALIGVSTNSEDSSKQYNTVYNKAFLNRDMMDGIEKGFKFNKEFQRKSWTKFETDVEGEYGFTAFYKLQPISEYNKTEDVAAAKTTHVQSKAVTPVNSKY